MKKILLSLMAVAIALVSCKKEEQITPEIKADKTEIAIPVAGTEDAEEDVFITFKTNVDWTAAVKDAEWLTITPAKGTAEKGQIKLIAEASKEKDPRTAVVLVTAGTAQQEFKVIQGQVNAFSLVAESAEIGSKGGEVELKVMTNIPYEVTIPEDFTWVKKAATKAYGEQVTKLSVAAFDELDGERTAALSVKAEGFDALTFTITQKGPTTLLWSVDMHKVMNRVASYVPAGEEKAGTAVSIALWGDKVVVCSGDGSKPVLLDKITGEKKGELETGEAKAMYVTNDDAGNLVFCNRVYNYWTSYAFFTIWYMKPGDTTPTKLVSTADSEYYPSYIGAGLNVRGDVTKDAAIAAPWEGVPGVTGENMVLGWNVKGGVPQDYVKPTLTGIVAISWMSGYWCAMPNNFPGFALAGPSLSAGAVFSTYDENVVYAVAESGACTKLEKIYVPYYDADKGEEIDVAGNYNSGAMDFRNINGKNYCAYVLSPFYGGTPIIRVYDAESKTMVYTPKGVQNYASEDDPKEPFENFTSTAAAVRLEAASQGFNVYHISNACSSIEAFSVPVK